MKASNLAGSRKLRILRRRSNKTRSASKNHRATNKNGERPGVEKNSRAIQRSAVRPVKNKKMRAMRTEKSLKPSPTGPFIPMRGPFFESPLTSNSIRP